MKWRAAVLMAAVVMVGCSSLKPVQIAAGDICFNCRRMINDPTMAAEIVDTSGLAYKFRTVGCMARFLKKNPDSAGAIYVTDHATRRFIKASTATFVPIVIVEGYNKTPDYIAFGASAEARKVAEQEKTTPVEWKDVLAATE